MEEYKGLRMDTKAILELLSSFKEVQEMIKEGKLTLDDFKNILRETSVSIKAQIEEASEIMKITNPSASQKLKKEAILTVIAEERENYDYKKDKKSIISGLKMVKAMDEELNEVVLYPFVEDIFKCSNELMSTLHPEKAKALRKALKKIRKDND